MKFLSKHIKGNSLTSDALRRLLGEPTTVFCFGIILIYLFTALGVKLGLVAPSWQAEIGASRAEPTFGSGWQYWLGLDIFGRSVTAKVLQGTYTAIYVGLVSSLIATPIGLIMGALAGYFGGWIDDLITWVNTMVSNIPEFLLLVAIGFALGKGINTVCIALGVTTWVSIARLIRAEFMKHKNREYVQAAGAIGGGHMRKIFVHILPNVIHILTISFSLRFVDAIKAEVVLTYLGIGAQTGTASWGAMIDDSKGELVQGVWWGLAGATLGMFFICLAMSLFTDALRDAVDPKLRT